MLSVLSSQKGISTSTVDCRAWERRCQGKIVKKRFYFRDNPLVERRQSKPASKQSNSVANIFLVTGGFDTTCDERFDKLSAPHAGLLNHRFPFKSCYNSAIKTSATDCGFDASHKEHVGLLNHRTIKKRNQP